MRQWAGFRQQQQQQQLQLLWLESTHSISLRRRLLLRVELLLLSNSSNLPLLDPTTCSVSLELESSESVHPSVVTYVPAAYILRMNNIKRSFLIYIICSTVFLFSAHKPCQYALHSSGRRL